MAIANYNRYFERVSGVGRINHLFLCHFLSTWNARSYEFAATLFIAAAFPEGLSFMSWCGITISLAIIVFASTLGRWVDLAPSRLQTLLTSIFINRIVIIVSCIGWAILLAQEHPEVLAEKIASRSMDSGTTKIARIKFRIFLVILFLSIFERLSRVANLLSIESDWVPNLAILATDHKQFQVPQDLAHLNAVLGRIDLVCKLASPIVMAFLVSSTKSRQVGPLSLIVLNFITWPLEYWTARQVWAVNRSLQDPKPRVPVVLISNHDDHTAQKPASRPQDWTWRFIRHVFEWFSAYVESLKGFFSSDVWMPAIAVTSLHFSVLAFSGILTVFLLQSGFSVKMIMLGEVVSAIFELSSTFVYPWGVKYLSVRRRDQYVALRDEVESSARDYDESEDQMAAIDQSIGASRLGLLSQVQMLVALIPTIPAIWQFSNLGTQTSTDHGSDEPSVWKAHLTLTLVIIFFVSASRLGRWIGALSVQQLAQSCVKPNERSVFAGTQASLASVFGLGHWVITAIWSRHEDFKWVVCLSLGVVVGSTALYGFWLLKRSPAAIRG